MLDFVATVVLIAVTTVNLNAFISTAPVSRVTRLGLAIAVGLWIGLATALSSVGALDDAGRRAFPLIGVMVLFPVVVAGVIALVSPAARKAMLGVPLPLLIGLNFSRVLGFFFLLLAAEGRLAGPFPYSAGIGDIITGLLAIPVAIAVARGGTSNSLLHWNIFGVLDFVLAIFFGVTSTNGSNLQLFHYGVGSGAITHLPWSLIPTVLVPFYLIAHGIIFAHWRRAKN